MSSNLLPTAKALDNYLPMQNGTFLDDEDFAEALQTAQVKVGSTGSRTTDDSSILDLDDDPAGSMRSSKLEFNFPNGHQQKQRSSRSEIVCLRVTVAVLVGVCLFCAFMIATLHYQYRDLQATCYPVIDVPAFNGSIVTAAPAISNHTVRAAGNPVAGG